MEPLKSNKSTIGKPAVVKALPPARILRELLIPELTAAHAAIGELRGFIGGLQNPDLLIAPFRKREAVASSAIEGTRATLDEVMQYEARDEMGRDLEAEEHDPKTQDIREIMNYEHAMRVALKELKTRPIAENLIKKTHFTLLESVRGANKDRGNFRKAQVAVGDYIPPVHTDIASLIDNWEKYLNSSDEEQDALIRIGVAHYQFEAIHPFMDGNGRIGRLIIPLFLCQEGILQTPVLYVSHFFEKYKVEYQRLLHDVDLSQEWTPWLKFFLKAVEAQAKITTAMAKEIQTLYEQLKNDTVIKIRSQHAITVLDLMFRKPILTASHVRDAVSARSKGTAYNLLDKFVQAGVLKEVFVIGKERFYGFTELRKIIKSKN
ncbi:MAG: Fic/DOC family N-terminal domain-containing protein [Patescibacteria group bacterium]